MKDYQQEFIQFAIDQGVLTFGEFHLKSGRISPWFFNSGLFNTGLSLVRLGDFYARALIDSGIEFDTLFGPAYKGIPLVTSTAIALANNFEMDVPYVFNRKEAKTHGEGGHLVGAQLKGRVLIVDDVITAGTAVRESIEIIERSSAGVAGVLISVDREERGKGSESAIQEVEHSYGVPVIKVVGFTQIIEYLEDKPEAMDELIRMKKYHQQYGISAVKGL